jgi:phage tail protein X
MAYYEYRCQQGDVLDAICHQHYGAIDGLAEQVLDANPGLASHGPVLPHGLVIRLPVLEVQTSNTIADVVQLWE